jgi:flagellar biogenesis protein FliO
MEALTDPQAGAVPVAGTLWVAGLRLSLAVAVLAVAAGLWLHWQRRSRGATRQLEVLDRAFLARGVSVALLRVGGRRLLVGVSGEGVRLIRDLEAGPTSACGASFVEALAEATSRAEVRP